MDDQLSPYRDNKMTPEQKEKLTEGIIFSVSFDGSFLCPSDFGLDNILDYPVSVCTGGDNKEQCKECARQACQKFFEEHGL